MKFVVLVLTVGGGALWALDRFLTRIARKLGSTGLGPPWVRETRRRLAQLPALLEAAIGVGVPVLYAVAGPWLIRFDSPGAADALKAHQWGAIGYALTASGAFAAWAWARPSRARRAAFLAGALFAGMAGGAAWGILGQAENLGFGGALPFATAFVMYRRGREAQLAARPSLTKRDWRTWSGLGAGLVAAVTIIGWFFPGVG